MIDWLGKPYYSLDAYMKHHFGQKVYKIAVDAGLNCPNRDGTLGYGGCIFCSEGGSGDFAVSIQEDAMRFEHRCGQVYHKEYAGRQSMSRRILDVSRQIERGMAKFQKKVGEKFVIYFQAFTNTYGDREYLEAIWQAALEHPDVVGISIATRPDCLGIAETGCYEQTKGILEVLRRLQGMARERGQFVWVELGLQTIHEQTVRRIRRGYDNEVYEKAADALSDIGIEVITHVILGLPDESTEDMLETVRYVCNPKHKVSGIKLQLLHVLKGTDLCKEYEAGEVRVMEYEEYLNLIAACLKEIPKDIVIHRLTGDGPKSILVAPMWSANKRRVLNGLHKTFKEQGIIQGKNT